MNRPAGYGHKEQISEFRLRGTGCTGSRREVKRIAQGKRSAALGYAKNKGPDPVGALRNAAIAARSI